MRLSTSNTRIRVCWFFRSLQPKLSGLDALSIGIAQENGKLWWFATTNLETMSRWDQRFQLSFMTASIWCHNLVFHPIYSTILEWLWCNRYFHVTNCLQKYSVCMSLSYADLKRTLKSAIHIRKAKKIRSFMKIVLTFFISLLLLIL